MKTNERLGLVNSILLKCINKGKSLNVVQRYLKMRYRITITNSVLDNRVKSLRAIL